MKVKKLIMVLLCVLFVIRSPLNAYAKDAIDATNVLALENGEPGIMPLWDYTDSVTLKLSFVGSTAVCELGIMGGSVATSIKANMWIYEANSDGSWTLLNGWRNIVVQDNDLDIVRYHNPVYYGETYKLYFTGKVYGPNGIYYDPLVAETVVER